MRVTGNIGIHFGEFCSDFIHTVGAVFTFTAIVNKADEHIHLTAQLLDHGFRLVHGSVEGHMVIMRGIGFPAVDMWSGSTKEAHLHALNFKNGVRLGIFHAAAVRVGGISQENIPLEVGNGACEHAVIIIELMIAQIPNLIIQQVEGIDHRMHGITIEQGDHIGLNGVAVVNQNQFGINGPLLLNVGSGASQACVGSFLIGGIIVGIDGTMQVTGGHQGDGYGVGSGLAAKSGSQKQQGKQESEKTE